MRPDNHYYSQYNAMSRILCVLRLETWPSELSKAQYKVANLRKKLQAAELEEAITEQSNYACVGVTGIC